MIRTSVLSELQIQQLELFRKKIHQYPELSGKEKETAARVVDRLKTLDPERIIEQVGGHGVIACFKGKEPGPTVLLRAELDALPIEEENNFSHRSKKEGVSHKCGHDGHMTCLLGVGEWLADNPLPRGRVLLLFQPSEEDGSGAGKVLEDLKFKALNIDFAYSWHNIPGYPLGTIVLRKGAFTPAVNSLIVRLAGKTAHAAEPEKGHNPAYAIAEIIRSANQMQQMDNEREDFVLITPIYSRFGGKAYGTAAGAGEVHFTLRAWENHIMEEVTNRLLKVMEEVADRDQLKLTFDWTDTFYGNTNNPEAIDMLEEVAREAHLNIQHRDLPMRWGEDFGSISSIYQGAMFGIGSGTNQPALHRPEFDFPDELIPIAVQMMAGIIHKRILNR